MAPKIAFSTLRTALMTTALASAGTAFANDLTIEVQGVVEAKGSVYVALYDKSDTWMKKAVKAQGVVAVAGKTIVVFKDLPEGEYAFSAFHDVDGDKKMAKNVMGMPTEPWGFSKDAMGMFGPPSFDEAKVKVPAGGTTTVMTLKS
ncbi:MAG: DUF2141 domain-containing protein [Betaproteobacteria bacterium]|nr:DUF2141 domain-containing protein [Betaproteobacteria bacterium]